MLRVHISYTHHDTKGRPGKDSVVGKDPDWLRMIQFDTGDRMMVRGIRTTYLIAFCTPCKISRLTIQTSILTNRPKQASSTTKDCVKLFPGAFYS